MRKKIKTFKFNLGWWDVRGGNKVVLICLPSLACTVAAPPSGRERAWPPDHPTGEGRRRREGRKGKGEKDRRWGRWKIQFYSGYKRIIISTETGGGRKGVPLAALEQGGHDGAGRKSFHQNSFKPDQKVQHTDASIYVGSLEVRKSAFKMYVWGPLSSLTGSMPRPQDPAPRWLACLIASLGGPRSSWRARTARTSWVMDQLWGSARS